MCTHQQTVEAADLVGRIATARALEALKVDHHQIANPFDSARGVLDTLSHPYVASVTEKRDYAFSSSLDLPLRVRDVQRDLSFFKAPGIGYDSSGVPVKIEYANDTTQTITRDAMHRPQSISSRWVGDPVAPSEPGMTTHSTLKTGDSYNFQLTSQTGQASYAVDISAPSGWRRQVSGLHPDSQNVFSISEGEFSPNETNFVRVKIESPQPSGYSAPVSLSFDPAVGGASTNQIRTLSISRSGTNIILRWALNQANGKQTKLYFKRADNGTTYLLTPQALNSSLTSFTLDSQALASPCGNFWGTQFQTSIETGPGPSSDLGSSRPGEQGTQDGCGGPPPPSPAPAMKFVNSYRHLDHLGSLRIARGDIGAPEGGVSSALDLYPFGSPFASAVANSRRQFTGHERDAGAGMDYMLARTNSAGIDRFLSADPVDLVEAAEDADKRDRMLRQTTALNGYAYCQNNPVSLVDVDGREAGYVYTPDGAVLHPWDPRFPRSQAPIRDTVVLAAAFAGALIAGPELLVVAPAIGTPAGISLVKAGQEADRALKRVDLRSLPTTAADQIGKTLNALRDHMKLSDVAGFLRDLAGRASGGQHGLEVGRDTLKSLERTSRSLAGALNRKDLSDASRAAIQKALDAVTTLIEKIKTASE